MELSGIDIAIIIGYLFVVVIMGWMLSLCLVLVKSK